MKPDDIPEVIWEEALSLHRGCAMDPRRSAAIPIALALLQVRSQAYDEAIKVIMGHVQYHHSDGGTAYNPMVDATVLVKAIRQHSQKGEDK